MHTNYKLSGTPNSPVLIFSNSLGTTMNMWDEVTSALLPYFQVLQYDTRGHGNSTITSEPYSIPLLGQDVVDLMNQLKIKEAHFCGLSMGGLIGQWLAIHHPKRIKKLVLSNTAAKIGDAETWIQRIKTIKTNGMQSITDATMQRWFTDEFVKNNKQKIEQQKVLFLNNNAVGYTNACAAVRDADFRESVKKITSETLVIAGDGDVVTNVEHANYLVSEIAKSELKVLKARHLSSVELPQEFATILIDFIVGESTFERGMHVRRTVLGNEHVNKATEKINSFNDDFQNLIANVPWGSVWTRPAMSKHDRSLITLSMLIALGREAEFKMHVRAAFNNGVSITELKELILQSAIYCGFPAANDAYKIAEEVIRELKISMNE
jgi:3-oxoadipate enol-lactonase / 4-carboxymuconolactone decarboxylase